MDQNVVANTLSLTLFSIALVISLRAFLLCFQSFQERSYRLFILALSMGFISLTAIASYASDNISSLPLNVDWFKYTSQTVCFLFICLSLFSNSDRYLRSVMYWHLAASVLLLVLLAPFMPAKIPDPAVTKTLLGGSRAIICFVIFFCYVYAFMTKETRFSLLMSGAFLLLAIGYVLNVPKYVDPHLTLLDHIGDEVRIGGLLTLLGAIFAG